MFGSLMESTMDAYINDMVVKNKEKRDHLKDFAGVRLNGLSASSKLAQANP